MKSVLVTGANGFVGRSLCAKLANGPWQVRAAVRTPLRTEGLPAGADAVAVGSIGPETDWSNALRGIDTVIHLASMVPKPGVGPRDRDAFMDTNAFGSRRLAESAVAAGVKRMVFLSSIEVHGKSSEDGPFTEDDKPDPQSYYGYSKLRAERELQELAETTGLEVVIIRSPLIYGPGSMGHLMSLAISFLKKGLPLPLASVTNRRSFIYIENLLDALIACGTSPGAAGNVFLVSDDGTVSTPELFRLVAESMERKPRMFSFPVPWLNLAGRIFRKEPATKLLTCSYDVDDSKIGRVIGWRPPFTMKDGISATVGAAMNAPEPATLIPATSIFSAQPAGEPSVAGSSDVPPAGGRRRKKESAA